ncbi:MAG TPA: septal ring lytic transglycosylase RlpA family protein [Candidatus Limnocylindrales bacterium]|nr:septal ring lytic transglycosylase RlpA family protein [Candidatus Limnocylindrales bacterium]
MDAIGAGNGALGSTSLAYDAPAPAIQTSDGSYRVPALAPLDGPTPTAVLPGAPKAPGELSDSGHVGRIVNVWRNDPEISWYGPGMYGQRTACGYALTMTLVGVAHRTLPCGTIVQFRWNGHTVSVPVVDRGPYVAGRIFDLTYGACAKLGHCYTGPIQYRIP